MDGGREEAGLGKDDDISFPLLKTECLHSSDIGDYVDHASSVGLCFGVRRHGAISSLKKQHESEVRCSEITNIMVHVRQPIGISLRKNSLCFETQVRISEASLIWSGQ